MLSVEFQSRFSFHFSCHGDKLTGTHAYGLQAVNANSFCQHECPELRRVYGLVWKRSVSVAQWAGSCYGSKYEQYWIGDCLHYGFTVSKLMSLFFPSMVPTVHSLLACKSYVKV